MITVLLPAYNAEKYISRAIESVLSQTYIDFELLVINDGSTDDTLNIIKSYTDDRVRLVNLQENVGLISALNTGLNLADSKYIARMDADDICQPTRLERQVEFLEGNAEYVACGTSIINFNDSGEGYMRYPETDEEIRVALTFFERNICHPTVMIRRSSLEDNGIKYRSEFKYAEDYTLWIDLARIGKLYNLKDGLLYYHRHENQVSSVYYPEQMNVSRKIVRNQLNTAFPSLTSKEVQLIKNLCIHEQGIYPEIHLTLTEIKEVINKVEAINSELSLFSPVHLKKILFFKRFRCSFYYIYRFNYFVKLRCFIGYFYHQPIRAVNELQSIIKLLFIKKSKI
ncbi:glycosyltransferase [Vibrio lamellibrachiae]|uniref:glycosyltransferase family 2 protein n=1 Tax=Vibrio lamellibrachiae TaxID=2910253 RepID=UPI003D0C2E96